MTKVTLRYSYIYVDIDRFQVYWTTSGALWWHSPLTSNSKCQLSCDLAAWFTRLIWLELSLKSKKAPIWLGGRMPAPSYWHFNAPEATRRPPDILPICSNLSATQWTLLKIWSPTMCQTYQPNWDSPISRWTLRGIDVNRVLASKWTLPSN